MTKHLIPVAVPAAVPTGFAPLPTPPGFAQHCGGFFLHESEPVLASRIGPHHLNSIGIVHGGYLATLADSAFGVIIKRTLDLPAPPPTINLSVDYIGAVRDGDWVEARVEVLKTGSRITNASCVVTASGRTVLRASGIFIMAVKRAG